MAKEFYSVAVFLTDRAYGGPEEGGWWYDYGALSDEPEHAELTLVFSDIERAYEYARRLNETSGAKWNEGRRADIGSVLSEGRYEAVVVDGYPANYPSERPHYC